jgi:hypothetical protein
MVTEGKYDMNRNLLLLRKIDSLLLSHQPSKSTAEQKIEDSEDELSYHLGQSDEVIRFTQDMTFCIVKKALSVGMNDAEISVILEFKMMPSTVTNFPEKCLKRPGYSHEHAMSIIDEIKGEMSINESIRLKLGSGIHQMMGALWRFPYVSKFILLCVEHNSVLAKKLIAFFRNVFNADLTLDQIKEIIKKDAANEDVLYDCFVCTNISHLNSAQRKQLGNAKYVRKQFAGFRPEFLYKGDLDLKHGSFFNDNDSVAIMKGSSTYTMEPTSVYAQVMATFGKKLISGPSGSTVAMFVTAFEFAEMPRTSLNYALFLGCCIANYIPAYHTLTEILMSFTDELDDYILQRKFSLDNDPVQYSIDFMRYNGADVSSFDSAAGMKHAV